jgi:hypothetical protein
VKLLFFNNHFHYVMVIPGHRIYVFRSWWFFGLTENNQPKSNGGLIFFRLSQFLFLIFWVNGLVQGKIYRKWGNPWFPANFPLNQSIDWGVFSMFRPETKNQEAFPDGLHFREPCPAAQPGHRSSRVIFMRGSLLLNSTLGRVCGKYIMAIIYKCW